MVRVLMRRMAFLSVVIPLTALVLVRREAGWA